jgi:esterase/lipase superfamily enzyme
MYLVKCSNCGFVIEDIKKVSLLFGSKVFSSDLLVGSFVDKKRKLANLLNDRNIPCPECKETNHWTWV